MANASDFGEESGPPSASLRHYAAAAASAAELASLGLLICVGLAGNGALSLLLLRDASLRRAPYFFLLDLCLADVVRSAVCLPFVVASVRGGGGGSGSEGSWGSGSALRCRLAAFLSAMLCFHAAFLLLGVSVTRYLAVAHHRFYAKRVTTACASAAVVCAAWTLAAAMALPPALSGTYVYEEEQQCVFQHRRNNNDALGFALTLAAAVAATHAVYAKVLCFVRGHRKMKPAQPAVPAVSRDWTFHGPGASGQAAANWIAGFGRGPTPPTLVGVRQASRGGGSGGGASRRLLVLDEFKAEKRVGRMYYMITLAFLVLWAPYWAACCVRVFARAVPQVYLSAAAWMSFAQAGATPVVSLAFNKELRARLRARLRWRSAPRTRTPTEPYCVT
ncbi:unnamed protein product [Merluccius merluccius]